MSSVEHSSAPEQGSLKGRVLRAASWTTAGYAARQVLRLGSNLIMTRLLFPEAFGLMIIVQAVLVGVTLMSDLAATQSVVRSSRGSDAAYVNTAWTIQILQGVLIAAVVVIAAEPLARHFGQPLLVDLLRVAALSLLFTGFNSTKIATAERRVEVKRLALIDTIGYAISIVAMILLAWRDPTPFALVQGTVIGNLCKMLASHFLLPGPHNRLAWDRHAARNVFSFGSKVMLSSSITFLAGEGSKLLSANLVSVELLALIGLANNLNTIVWNAIQQLSGRVLFPAYAEVLRNDPGRLPRVLERTRAVQLIPACAASLIFALFGSKIVHFLYDARYADAGLILQITAIGMMTGALTGSYSGVLWAMNRVGLSTVLLAIQVALQWGGMLIGYRVAGPLGVVVGGTLGTVLNYPVTAAAYGRLGLWHRRVDIPVLVLSALTAMAVIALADWSIAARWGSMGS